MGSPRASFSTAGLRCRAGCRAGASPASRSPAINAGNMMTDVARGGFARAPAFPPIPQADAFSLCMNRMLPNLQGQGGVGFRYPVPQPASDPVISKRGLGRTKAMKRGMLLPAILVAVSAGAWAQESGYPIM